MEFFAAIGSWISEHESLLSGAAAMLALLGVAISILTIVTKRITNARKSAAAPSGETVQRSISLSELTAPAPYPVKFAHSDGLRIAYAQMGHGPHEIMMAPGIISHLNICSHLPSIRNTVEAIGEFSNIVTFDKRGQGLSDPCMNVPDMTERVHDIEAVLDAVGLDKVILYGLSEGGPMCIKFAHDHPERVKGLILVGTTARWLQGEDFPGGIEEKMLDLIASAWGTGKLRSVFFPSVPPEVISDETYVAFERLISTRSSVKQLIEYIKQTDVRKLLPGLTCPTLVLHFAGDLAVPVRLGRATADAIPDAEFVELPGTDHADLSSAPEGIEKIRQFVERVNSA
ncbi:alpha/beta hydrolase [Congregibacter variabilis]|uniref:Alpha/beta hydrolase n=1 Tax=Congregibacter variabilis TaxID=3081200 RepID=A0ABZ0I9J1_9GAMM|nr:alpha/beta hydrolase [Congregibacter sp. IMCC43200]